MELRDVSYEALVDELETIADKTIEDVVVSASEDGSMPSDIPNVAVILNARYPGRGATLSSEVLREMLKAAAEYLPDEVVDGRINSKWKTWKQIAKKAYNLEGENLAHLSGRRYSALLAEIFGPKNSGVPEKTRSNKTRDLREMLAGVLMKWHKQLLHHEESVSDTANAGALVATSPYVERPEFRRQFDNLIDQGVKLIVLCGPPGMGKTTLAQMLTNDVSEDDEIVPFVRFRQGVPNAQDVSYVSALGGKVVTEPTMATLTRIFADTSIRLVVLDNLYSGDELREVLPRKGSGPTVVATCRVQGTAPPEHAHFVQVERMTLDESREMIESRLSRVQPDDAAALADALYHYPLLMQYACKLIEFRGFPVSQFIEAANADPARMAKDAFTASGEILEVVLRELTDLLGTRSELALKILAFMALIGPEPVANWTELRRFMAIDRPTPGQLVEYESALRIASVEFGLLQVEDGLISAHPMLHDMFRSVLGNFRAILHEHAAHAYTHGFLPLVTRNDDPNECDGAPSVVVVAKIYKSNNGEYVLGSAIPDAPDPEIFRNGQLTQDGDVVVTVGPGRVMLPEVAFCRKRNGETARKTGKATCEYGSCLCEILDYLDRFEAEAKRKGVLHPEQCVVCGALSEWRWRAPRPTGGQK